MSKPFIFEDIFQLPWRELPPVMQKHYAVRPDSQDRVVVRGMMSIRRSRWVRWLSPLLRMFGALVPWDGSGVPVTVNFYSGEGSSAFHFDRVFNLPGRSPFRFHSRLEPIKGNEVIEVMRGGLGWRSRYLARGNHIVLEHVGYYWKVGRWLLPMPMLTWVLGRGAAEEEALSDDTFKMWMTVTHPLFGEAYRYEGVFEIAEVIRA
jgi:hypothetical protein